MGACTVCGTSSADTEKQKVYDEAGKASITEQDLQRQAAEWKQNRTYYGQGEEDKFRGENAMDIMQKRWQWYQDNKQLFALILKNHGFAEEDISASMEHTRPLGMTAALYGEFTKLLRTAAQAAMNRVRSEHPELQLGELMIVLQGSYIVGYSSNPRKGDRYIPNWLFDPTNKSDYDFRCYAHGFDQYVTKLRESGTEIKDWGGDRSHIIRPEYIGVMFPEFEKLIEDFKELTKKYFNGKSVGLQVTVMTKDTTAKPFPWDFQVDLDGKQ